MLTVRLKEEGLADALARIDGLLADLSPVFQQIGQEMVASTQDRTRRGLSPDGSPLAPRSETSPPKRPKGGPLLLTGTMIGTLYARADARGLRIGSGAVQSAVMQHGAVAGAFGRTRGGKPIPFGDIPARPFLGLSDEDRTAIGAILEEWVAELGEGG